MEYNLKRESLRGLLDAPRRRSMEIRHMLREMEAEKRAETRIAKRSRKRSYRRRDGKRTTEQLEHLRAEDRSLQLVIDRLTQKIRTLKEPDYASCNVWNRVYKLNEVLDTLQRMLPPSHLPVNS